VQKKHVFVLLLSIVILTSLLVLHIQGRISAFNGNDPILVVSTDGFLHRVNETIKICLRIVNPTFSPMTFHFSSGYQFDFAISKNSIVIYRWAADKLFIQVFTKITIPPLNSVTRCYSHRPQDCFLGSGIYQVSGYLVGYGGASTTIVVI
jgi:hypothetical protein